MPRTPGKTGRSTSRGRGAKSTPKSKKTSAASPKSSKSPKTPANKMEYTEGDTVMARWPGTTLYFKAKVQFVRDDDNEYDVQYEDGTVFTIRAKDVRKFSAKDDMVAPGKKRTTPSRSRSRGRSPGRKAKQSPARTPKKSPSSSSATTKRTSRSTTRKSAVKAPKPDATPTRSSARLASNKVELSSDEEDGKKAIPNPPLPRGKGGRKGLMGFLPRDLNLSWVRCLFLMVAAPLALISLHLLCQNGKCKMAVPVLPRKISDYWNPQAFFGTIVFVWFVKTLSYLPLGTKVMAANGHEVRTNGIFTLLTALAIIPALVYNKVDISVVSKNYWYIMTSSIILSIWMALVAFIISRWGKRSNANPKGNTGNLIVDFYNGREFNPYMWIDLKMLAHRIAMIGLAVLNVFLVLDSLHGRFTNINWAVVMPAAFQVVFALDAMVFEENFFFSHDALNCGFGYAMAQCYLTYPFGPTLITRYLIARNPTLSNLALTGIFIVHAIGLLIYRTSESQRVEFAKNPNSSNLKHMETIATYGGRKIMCGGYWGLVRYPNYLGEIILHISWVMAAASVAGRNDLLIYVLPFLTVLFLVIRCREQNTKNKRKYGTAWNEYCEKVRANLIPFIY